MAPSRRGRRRGVIATALRQSIETAANSTPPLSGSNHPSKRSNISLEPGETDDPQIQGLETPARQTYALVLGEEMLVPQTYDPETYDPERRMPWTPEPEPYDPETYAAWGWKQFGDDWYELRKIMLQERNIHLQYDQVYKERQRALRIMEHKIERRPFEPRGGWMWDEGWKRLWARLAKELGIEIPASPTPSKDKDDTDTDLSGYNTYAPTPEPREPTPILDDPWEELELNRRRFHWDEERYQFERIFLKEALIDGARTRHEDEPGDRQAREKREVMESFRYVDPSRFSLEQRRFQDHIDLPKKGWTQEEINAMYDAEAAMYEWRQKNPAPKGSGDFGKAVTPGEGAASDSWLRKHNAAWIRFYGELPLKGSGRFGMAATQEEEDAKEIWRKNIHARVSSRQPREAQAGIIGDASTSEVASNPRISSPRQTNNVLYQTRSGRITKNAPTYAESSPRDRRRRPSEPDMLEELGDNTRAASQRRNRQRKTYKKERASRRLAGELPEYGMLPGQGEAEPLYKATLRQPSNTRRTSTSGPRSGRLSKNPTAVRSEKPQGIVKPRRAGTSRPKRPAKGSKG
ncbi:hypothetical protein F5Y03DRAFT_397167 [Xylaria venustula]|nr:hypothetical protein F5Y03DRAFT_397167 [Xylaria venustula]